ncbi:hypothetical protein CASFOL_001481 [Castilleja foliolosa]|uniref:Uncharacterized protein n=1 Tax=Castilleja foliolosa TaxID=1961234 RepID=A0ABD3ENA0_9LAMI
MALLFASSLPSLSSPSFSISDQKALESMLAKNDDELKKLKEK